MSDSRSVTAGFFLMVTGQIDACQMQGADNLYVKYSFNKGHDWSVLAVSQSITNHSHSMSIGYEPVIPSDALSHQACGVEHGVSQIAKRSSGGTTDTLVWNYPLDIMFRSSNVHGWPQIVLGVYGLTAFGGDVVRGYGCTHIPTQPGRYTRYIQLYTPVSSSLCQRITAWITNNPPEFFDSKFIAQGKGREVTRVRSHGVVKVTFNVTTKNMNEWGYQVGGERTNNVGSSSSGSGGEANMQQQQQPQLFKQPSYEGSRPGSASANANNAFGGIGGGGLSSRSNGGDSSRSNQGAGVNSVPPRTQLSAATTAGLAANRQRNSMNAASSSSAFAAPIPFSSSSAAPAAVAGIAPPSLANSRANSRENSRRDLFAGQSGAAAAASSSSSSAFPSSSQPQQQAPFQSQQSQQSLQGGNGFDSSMDEFEGKYPSGGGGGGGFDRQPSTLLQRGPSMSMRPDNMQQPTQMQGMGLAPLRSGGGRQLPPM